MFILKKEDVKDIVQRNEIDILCLQEVEVEFGFNSSLLEFGGYSLEVETNSLKSRTAIYIKNGIRYNRRYDLEGNNSHLVIIDVKAEVDTRIINLYRCFTPQDGSTARQHFQIQLDLIKGSYVPKSIVLGDFNIDYGRKFDVTYTRKDLFNDFDTTLGNLSLIQLIDFSTWSRFIRDQIKESILDHVYVADPFKINDIKILLVCVK